MAIPPPEPRIGVTAFFQLQSFPLECPGIFGISEREIRSYRGYSLAKPPDPLLSNHHHPGEGPLFIHSDTAAPPEQGYEQELSGSCAVIIFAFCIIK